MRTMHLFAGGGGGLLADLILGHEPICAVEWEPYACQILRERAADGWFPNLHVHEGDIRLFDPSEYAGRVDCIHAGFPCQDISVAGKQTGLGEGTRSGLYREVLRVASIVGPCYLFLENVSAIRSKGLEAVLKDLATLGYDSRWCCIRASDVGAPHGRDRWWLLAKNKSMGNAEHDGQLALPQLRGDETASNDWRQEEPQPSGQPARTDRSVDVPGVCRCKVSDPIGNGLQGSGGDGDTAGQTRLCSGARSNEEQGLRSEHLGRQIESGLGGVADELAAHMVSHKTLQGWWEVEPNIGRTTCLSENRAAMLKCLGNGQVPLQAAAAWRLLMRDMGTMKTEQQFTVVPESIC